MRRFTVLVIALVLAPGLQSAVLGDITTYPLLIAPEVTPEVRPEIIPELRPELLPELTPELRPEPVPEVEAVVPELISVNPCEQCFEYMTALIDQLTNVAVPESDLPVVGRPLPENVQIDPELRPLPLPVEPEVEIRPLPLPIPSEAEAEVELAVQDRPLPTHIIR